MKDFSASASISLDDLKRKSKSNENILDNTIDDSVP